MRANIPPLPQELVDSITRLLPIADLKNSRFISRAWNSDYARRYLFKTVVLRMNLLSYHKLQALARHSTFSTYIKYIIYDLRTVQADTADESLTGWQENIAGVGLGLRQPAIKELIWQCSQDQVETCHRNFCRYIDGQEWFKNDFVDEKQILDKIIPRLPNLRGIEYSYQGKAMDDCLRAPKFASLGPIAQWMLVEPDACIGEELAETHFWRWGSSITRSRMASPKSSPIKELCLKDFKAHPWQHLVADTVVTNWKLFLPLLERLSISTTKYSDTEDYKGLVNMLEWTRNLKLLDLSFGVMQKGRVSLSMELHKFIKKEKRWNQLTTLSLDGFATSEEYLRHLLRRLAPSLHTLSLANIKFRTDADPTQQHNPFLRIERSSVHGSWVNLVIFLHQHMKLIFVSFQGWLLSSWDENWVVAGQRSGDCLKTRVERYAAAARYPMSEFPFKPKAASKVRVIARMKTNSKGKERVRKPAEDTVLYRGCPWAVEDDESWRFEKSEYFTMWSRGFEGYEEAPR
jgi:hypothetical protein